MKRPPFKTPIFVADTTYLVGANHELICNTESATREELAEIVRRVNLVSAIHALLDGTEWNSDTTSAIAELFTDNGYTIKEPS